MRLLLLIAMVLFIQPTFALVRLPKILSDNMVLQREKPITIWGWADAKEKITIQFNKQTVTTVAAKDGKWKATLKAEVAGGPYQLIVKGKNVITLSNVLVGDVWICSGQSNMEWTLTNTENSDKEIQKADVPMIRHYKIPNTVSATPKDDVTGGAWQVTTPTTAGNFTAVGYYFARELNHELNVPIGLINTSWGGTHSETWTSREAFKASEEFKSMIEAMPHLNLDSLVSERMASMKNRIQKIQGELPGSQDKTNTWMNSEFNDSAWPTMTVPQLWEQQALGDLDGVVWYRKSFDVSAGEAGKEAIIQLAKIDDNDITYVNGVKVGATNLYSADRKYTIPAGVLKAGKNVVAVRVEDGVGGGGIYGDAADVRIVFQNSSYSLAGKWSFRVESYVAQSTLGPNEYPTLLFNAMINPILPLSIKGAIWYQGESNAGRSYQYRKAFPLMITDWRNHWKQGDFPFYFVQLASYNANGGNSSSGSGWAELREAQAMTLSLPNTGMAVTTDIGDPKDIHPRNKKDVGKRLAAIALNKTYGKNAVFSGPTYQSLQVEGNKAIISFTNIGSGLKAADKYGYIRGFEVAGADQKFHYAKASIEGDKVVVYCDQVTTPVAVRFGWADDASDNNLYNAEGFPAAPFRTDTWKGVTEGAKFSY